ncbi:hypothetical protein QTP70_000344 [Hemibagrus guttatus]|uniref:Uncharacterized protein n=1 Tax=Hemibagrus guttatus TaxID=175788 RepID=A0AAE0R9D2_9TELE|nr:hypothetical protein QTP70_000344 [Hemibagrus guttatus]
MGKNKDLNKLDKGQIVMARRLDQSISKTAALIANSHMWNLIKILSGFRSMAMPRLSLELPARTPTSLPSAEDAPSLIFFFHSSSSPGLAPPLFPWGTSRHFRFSVEDAASLLIGGGGYRPHLPPSLPSVVYGPAGLRSSLGSTARRWMSLGSAAQWWTLSALLLGGGRRSALLLGGGRLSALLLGCGRCSELLLGCGRRLGPSGLTAVPIAPPTCLALLLAPPTCLAVLHAPPTCLSVFLAPFHVLLDQKLFQTMGKGWHVGTRAYSRRMDPATSASGGPPLQNTLPITDPAELREIIVQQGAVIRSYQDQVEALHSQLRSTSTARAATSTR